MLQHMSLARLPMPNPPRPMSINQSDSFKGSVSLRPAIVQLLAAAPRKFIARLSRGVLTLSALARPSLPWRRGPIAQTAHNLHVCVSRGVLTRLLCVRCDSRQFCSRQQVGGCTAIRCNPLQPMQLLHGLIDTTI